MRYAHPADLRIVENAYKAGLVEGLKRRAKGFRSLNLLCFGVITGPGFIAIAAGRIDLLYGHFFGETERVLQHVFVKPGVFLEFGKLVDFKHLEQDEAHVPRIHQLVERHVTLLEYRVVYRLAPAYPRPDPLSGARRRTSMR